MHVRVSIDISAYGISQDRISRRIGSPDHDAILVTHDHISADGRASAYHIAAGIVEQYAHGVVTGEGYEPRVITSQQVIGDCVSGRGSAFNDYFTCAVSRNDILAVRSDAANDAVRAIIYRYPIAAVRSGGSPIRQHPDEIALNPAVINTVDANTVGRKIDDRKPADGGVVRRDNQTRSCA